MNRSESLRRFVKSPREHARFRFELGDSKRMTQFNEVAAFSDFRSFSSWKYKRCTFFTDFVQNENTSCNTVVQCAIQCLLYCRVPIENNEFADWSVFGVRL